MSTEPRDRRLPVDCNFRFESMLLGLFTYRRITLGLVILAAVAAFIRFGAWPEGTSGAEHLGAASQPDGRARVKAGTDVDATQRWSRQARVRHTSRSPARAEHTDEAGLALDRLDRALAKADPHAQQTADAIKRFAANRSTAELRQLDRNDVVALADYLASVLSPSDFDTLLEHYLGWPGSRVVTGENAGPSLVNIYDAISGNHRKEVRPSVLVVTDSADANGRIRGQAHVLPAGAQRVYAVFENDRAIEGLDQVLAVWRDPTDDKIVFTEFEPIRKGSAYNYVWLEVASGWPAGRYQVELFHPEAQSLLLAAESFSVR